MLKINSLFAGYGETTILEDVSLEIPNNGSLAVLGRNGVGKTTLLASIMGHTTHKSGEIIFNNKRIETMPIYERNRIGIGYVPQTRDIFASLTVEENLTVAARAGRWHLKAIYDLFPRLYERHENKGNQLSGGEQQMLSIGRALMGNPSLLLLDEPMEGLAPIIVEMLLKAFEALVADKSMAIILVEQHAKLALRITQNVVIMSRGRIVHAGDSIDLINDHDKLTRLIMEQV